MSMKPLRMILKDFIIYKRLHIVDQIFDFMRNKDVNFTCSNAIWIIYIRVGNFSNEKNYE